MLRIITCAVVIALLYRFLMRFVLPIFQITRQTSSRLRNMQQKLNDLDGRVNTPRKQKVNKTDYIDYEEVK